MSSLPKHEKSCNDAGKSRGTLNRVQRREAILNDYVCGMTAPEVAAKWGITQNAVYTMAHYWGAKLPQEEKDRRRAEASRKSANLRRGPRWSYAWRDCPPDKWEDFCTLRKYMPAREARAKLEGPQ